MSRAPRQSSPEQTVQPADSLSFEQALAELERLVEQMEGGKLTLEQSLAFHKRGIELARFCQDRLETAREQVRVLEGDVLKTLSASQAADDSATEPD
jgi:exodeoxyribonuclease VII small subunit